MGPTLFVLWIYFSHPWQLGPIPLTPGWCSASVFHDLESCQTAVRNSGSRAVCLQAGTTPPEPLAEIMRNTSPFARLDDE